MFRRKPKKAPSEFTYSDFMKYAKHFTDSGFQGKIVAVIGLVGKSVVLPALRLYEVFRSDATSVKNKLYIAGALGYFILPFDLIPDMLGPVLGFTDDLAVIALVMKLVSDNLTPEIEAKAQQRYEQLLHRIGL